MAPHSSTLAWKIPWTAEPGGLQSMGLWSQTRLSDFTFTFRFHALEKEMATHSSVLAWRIIHVLRMLELPKINYRICIDIMRFTQGVILIQKTLRIPHSHIKPCVFARAQSCLTLCNPADCRPPAFSVHGISKARVLEWLPFPPPGIFQTQGLDLCFLCLLHWQGNKP